MKYFIDLEKAEMTDQEKDNKKEREERQNKGIEELIEEGGRKNVSRKRMMEEI